MAEQALPFSIAPLTPADIAAVAALEQAAYATPVPKRDFLRELKHNRLAHYLALRAHTDPPAVVGVAGYWLLAGEAHVITIAIHPNWKRRGLGEYLLLSLLEDALAHQAHAATLEVRPGNLPALALYQKYQFAQVGNRPGYYDNGEDALILTAPPLASPQYRALLALRRQSLLHRLAQIDVDKKGQVG